MNDAHQDLHLLCHDWAKWHRSRRLFAPPVPHNILARMRPQAVREAPDALCSSDLSHFNLAILGMPDGTGKTAFYYFYLHQFRPIKLVASEMGISGQAFYKALKKFRGDAHACYVRMSNRRETNTVAKIKVDEIVSTPYCL